MIKHSVPALSLGKFVNFGFTNSNMVYSFTNLFININSVIIIFDGGSIFPIMLIVLYITQPMH